MVAAQVSFTEMTAVTVAQSRIGRFLRQRREALGLTQWQVVDLTGMAQNYISLVERGGIHRPSIERLRLFAKAYDLDADEVLELAGWQRNIIVKGGQPQIRLVGVVPANAVRWTAIQERGETVPIPQEWVDQSRAPLFAVRVSGDCLLRLGIASGDTVVCEEHADPRSLADDDIVLVRVGDEYTLKRWFRGADGTIELRDGEGDVVHRITDDDYSVLGLAVHHYGSIRRRTR